MPSTTTFTVAAAAATSLAVLSVVAELSPPPDVCEIRPCAPREDSGRAPVPSAPTSTFTVISGSTGNGSTGSGGTIISPPTGNISIQGYPPLIEQSTFDH